MTWQGILVPTTGRTDWLSKRKSGIGASDVAGILGLSPWASPFTVWADKRMDIEDEANDAMRWGKILEPVLIDQFTQATGLYVGLEDQLVRHPEHEWVLATVDGLVFEGPTIVGWKHPPARGIPNEYVIEDDFDPLGLVEVKTDHRYGKWDEIPDHYQVQITWQFLATGLTQAWVPVLHGGHQFEVYEYEWDETLADRIFTRVEAWYRKHVEGGEPPEVDETPATARVIKELWPESSGEVIELSADMAADVDALRGWKAELKRVEKEVSRLEGRIKTALQEAEVGTVGGFEVVSWKQVTSKRVDTTRLREERPDVAEKFSSESSYRRFTVKEEK